MAPAENTYALTLVRCQLCGQQPTIAYSDEIAPGTLFWAIHCSDPDNCYNDTHWQMSFSAAAEIWRHEQPCVSSRGGRGNADDDLSLILQ